MDDMSIAYAYLSTISQHNVSGWIVQVGDSTPTVVLSKRHGRGPLVLMLDALEDFRHHMPATLRNTTLILSTSKAYPELLDEEDVLPSNVKLSVRKMDGQLIKQHEAAFINYLHDNVLSNAAKQKAEYEARSLKSNEYVSQITATDIFISVSASAQLRYNAEDTYVGSAYLMTKGTKTSYEWYGRQPGGSTARHLMPHALPTQDFTSSEPNTSEALLDGLLALREALRQAFLEHPEVIGGGTRLHLVLHDAILLALVTDDANAPAYPAQAENVDGLLGEVKEMLSKFPLVKIVPEDCKYFLHAHLSQFLSKIATGVLKRQPGDSEQMATTIESEIKRKLTPLTEWLVAAYGTESEAA